MKSGGSAVRPPSALCLSFVFDTAGGSGSSLEASSAELVGGGVSRMEFWVRARVPRGMSFTVAGSAVSARRSYIFLRRRRMLRLCVEGLPSPGGTGGRALVLRRA